MIWLNYKIINFTKISYHCNLSFQVRKIAATDPTRFYRVPKFLTDPNPSCRWRLPTGRRWTASSPCSRPHWGLTKSSDPSEFRTIRRQPPASRLLRQRLLSQDLTPLWKMTWSSSIKLRQNRPVIFWHHYMYFD